MAEKITISISARGYELDSYNHVNNAVYLNYFEHARWEYFRQLNLSAFLAEHGNLPVVTDVHIRYQREIRLFDDLSVESSCAHEKPYLVFRQRILNKTTGLTAARATTKLIFIGADRIARDVPAEILSVISVPDNE
jgi:YbgC/YbaW family acyl-CoA thioester hydrolase